MVLPREKGQVHAAAAINILYIADMAWTLLILMYHNIFHLLNYKHDQNESDVPQTIFLLKGLVEFLSMSMENHTILESYEEH